jgi:type IV pilus assembly protein PilN
MTTSVEETKDDKIWAEMPGWGIFADLTPPELIALRGLRVLRKQLGFALAVVVLLCVAGYVWAGRKSSAADDRLAASQATTTVLTAQNAKYASLLTLQHATQLANTQVSTLMATDVDVASFVRRLHAVAPAGTVLTAVNVTLAAVGDAGTPAGPADPAVGTVTLSGTSNRMIDVASYVTALLKLQGVVNVIPATNSTSTARSRATWAITLQLTDKLYSHRFDATTANPRTGGGGH